MQEALDPLPKVSSSAASQEPTRSPTESWESGDIRSVRDISQLTQLLAEASQRGSSHGSKRARHGL